MPHLWTIFKALGEPRGQPGPLLITVLLHAAFFTAKEALAGFAMGARRRLRARASRSCTRARCSAAFLPYIVASQTIPILAIAPMVVVWARTRSAA